MPESLETLPAALLDAFVAFALRVSPSLRLVFLSSLGSRIHASCVRVLFSTLTIPDDTRILGSESPSFKSILSPILSNPRRYAHTVRVLVVRDPRFHEAYCSNTALSKHTDECIVRNYSPIEMRKLSELLEICENLEEFLWESSIFPPDGICEILGTHNTRLTRFYLAQSLVYQSAKGCLPKWHAPSLPLLSGLPLSSLRLSRLSQAGARALCSLLSNIGEYSSLEDITLDFVWLDDSLCENIVEAGRRLRRLTLRTSGTRLSDKGIIAITEGCETLEELTLQEVQGRLSRNLWSKPESYPAALRTFRVAVSECGPHHSWTTDHLLSLHAIPAQLLTSLSIVRLEAPPQLENGTPLYSCIIDDVASLKPVPSDFVDRMKTARSLTVFECDWWAWSIPDIKIVLESCPELEAVKLCLDAPFSKLLGLTSTFASLPNLRKLSVSVNPPHAPGQPPTPLRPFAKSPLPTPSESPVMRAKSVLPQLLDFDQMQTQTCLANLTAGDPSMPLMRDIRRFVRKCPQLALLEWYGKAGRGSWSVTRPTSAVSKISMNVTVDYSPPTITEDTWQKIVRCQEAEEAAQNGWAHPAVERVGQTWTGPVAKASAAEVSIGSENEDGSPNTEKERRLHENGRKAKSTPFIVPDDHGDQVTPSSTEVIPPLTPPMSDNSISTILSSVSESADSDSVHGDSLDIQIVHRRTPSEPDLRIKGPRGTRARSTTASAATEQRRDGDRTGYFNSRSSHSASSGAVSNGSKSGRGRGARTGRGTKKSNYNNGGHTSVDHAGREGGSGGRSIQSSSGNGGKARK